MRSETDFAKQFLAFAQGIEQKNKPESTRDSAETQSTRVENAATPDAREKTAHLKGFIASSTAALPIARAIQSELADEFDVSVWNQGAFSPSSHPMESLEQVGESTDFVVLIVTADDVTISNNLTLMTPRDNVVFEIGYFFGKLGRNRVFLVCQNGNAPELPSDLAGITQLRFRMHTNGNLQQSIAPAATRIRDQLQSTRT